MCYVLAMLSKASAVAGLLICACLLLAATVHSAWPHQENLRYRKFAPLFILWLAVSVPIVLLNKSAQNADIAFTPPFFSRFVIAGDAVSFYAYKLLAPLRLGIDYGRSPEIVLQKQWIYLSGLAPYLAALVLFVKRKAARPILLGLAILAASIAPVLGFLTFMFQRISTTADHYL
jgi:hypothetical protein